MNFVYLVSCEL